MADENSELYIRQYEYQRGWRAALDAVCDGWNDVAEKIFMPTENGKLDLGVLHDNAMKFQEHLNKLREAVK